MPVHGCITPTPNMGSCLNVDELCSSLTLLHPGLSSLLPDSHCLASLLRRIPVAVRLSEDPSIRISKGGPQNTGSARAHLSRARSRSSSRMPPLPYPLKTSGSPMVSSVILGLKLQHRLEHHVNSAHELSLASIAQLPCKALP